jgi:hypothetical protein
MSKHLLGDQQLIFSTSFVCRTDDGLRIDVREITNPANEAEVGYFRISGKFEQSPAIGLDQPNPDEIVLQLPALKPGEAAGESFLFDGRGQKCTCCVYVSSTAQVSFLAISVYLDAR